MSDESSNVGGFIVMTIYLSLIGAWLTHIVVCIQTSSWALLFFGAIIFPVAIVHGYGVWFGLF